MNHYNDGVLRWNAGTSEWQLAAGGNGKGSNADQLDGIGGVFVAYTGNVYVSDLNNHRVQMFTTIGASGMTKAGGSGSATRSIFNYFLTFQKVLYFLLVLV